MFRKEDFGLDQAPQTVKTPTLSMGEEISRFEAFSIAKGIMDSVASIDPAGEPIGIAVVLDTIAEANGLEFEEGYEFIADCLNLTTNALGFSESAVLDLFDEDEGVQFDELLELTSIINETGDPSAIATSIVMFDELVTDWTAYPNAGQCADGKLKTHQCKPCFFHGQKSSCRYPKKKKDGVYKGKTPTGGQKAHLNDLHKRERGAAWKNWVRLSNAKASKGKKDEAKKGDRNA